MPTASATALAMWQVTVTAVREAVMSGHAAFRRQPVPGEMAIQHQTVTLPAPIRGIIENENWAYTKPGCAVILDNWFPTQKGLKLRGGTERWLTLPDPVELVRSGFEYVSGAVQRMFAATETRLFDVSFADTPALVTGVGTQTDGNYSAAQLANTGGDWLLAVNDSGDYVRRYNGTSWTYLTTTTPTAWAVSHAYAIGDRALDTTDNTRWKCLVAHTSPGTGTFAAARFVRPPPTQWTLEMASDNVSFITGPVDRTDTDPERQGPDPYLEARQQVVLRAGRHHERMVPAGACCRRRVDLHPAVGRDQARRLAAVWRKLVRGYRLRPGRQVHFCDRPRRGRHIRRYRPDQLQPTGGRRAATTSRGRWARTRMSSWAATF